ncbi:hypothetical protein BH10ACI1_BH10ACI1_14160 [soil metagenome]
MNKDLQISQTGAAIFPAKINLENDFEVKTTEIKEVKVSVVRIIKTESRFARLKRNLRKRSHSIL